MAIWCIASEDVEHANRELVERDVVDCCTRKALLEDFARRSKADILQKTGDVDAGPRGGWLALIPHPEAKM